MLQYFNKMYPRKLHFGESRLLYNSETMISLVSLGSNHDGYVHCCLCTFTVGQLVHTLPEGEAVLGLTLLAGEIYLLRITRTQRDQIEVYDVNTYHFQRHLTVPSICGFSDMISCEYHRCVYIDDHFLECVHRLDVRGAVTWWAVNDAPGGLSVNAAHNVLVTCGRVHKIKEFSSYGVGLREFTLPFDFIHPLHAIQTRSGHFIVSHGYQGDLINHVFMMSADGHIVHSHGGKAGSHTGQYRVPCRLAVDDNECVFVADLNNRRVTLLSPTLEYVGLAVSRDQLKWHPGRLCYDRERRKLYVADDEYFKDDDWTAGRVVVFNV